MALAARREDPPWRVAHVDMRSVLLLPPVPANPADEEAARRALDEVDSRLTRAFYATQRDDRVATEKALVELVEREPLQLYAYGTLMLMAARDKEPAEIRRWLDAALAAYPRRSNRIWAFAEHAWSVAGRPKERLEALERIHPGSPFIREDARRELAARVREAAASLE